MLLKGDGVVKISIYRVAAFFSTLNMPDVCFCDEKNATPCISAFLLGHLLECDGLFTSPSKVCMKKKINQIVLTGFRATGKSTVGKLLAQRLGYTFLDTDVEICRQLGATVTEIVERYGWPHFRHAEADILDALCSRSNMVIATGGGAIEHHAQWQRLQEISFVVWLDADVATIQTRIADDPVSADQRPALSLERSSGSDATRQILQRRNPHYQSGSDLRLDTVLMRPDELAVVIHETIINIREKV